MIGEAILTLLAYAITHEYQLDQATRDAPRPASTTFLKTLQSVYLKLAKEELPNTSLELLRNQGVPTVSDQEFLQHIQKNSSTSSHFTGFGKK
ncbi:ion transport 2 domain protein [Calothrix sp. NIES-4101]|nr:ion transport 2 domain protein [Calothrix sp. NIES-4101]